MHLPEGPGTNTSDTSAPKYPYREPFKAKVYRIGVPGPPKEPKTMAQDLKIETIGSTGSIILGPLGGPGTPYSLGPQIAQDSSNLYTSGTSESPSPPSTRIVSP